MDDRDKRDYFRISDTVLIEFQSLSEKASEGANPADFFTSDPNFHLLRDIYELQLESQEYLRKISQENRSLGGFLSNLDKRVDLLARSLVQKEKDQHDLSDRQVEISEGGLSFLSPTVIEPGQHLAIRLLFQPSCLGIDCFGEVRHCQLEQDDYRIGIRFHQSDHRTQRLIARHIIRKQSEQRRERLHRHS